MKDTEKIVTALHLAPQLDINKMTNEIFVLRQQTINTAIMKQLQDLMREKGITELYAIDESKVMHLIKEHHALEIIKVFFKGRISLIERKYKNEYIISFDDRYMHSVYPINEEQYNLLKEVLYEKED